MKIDAVSDITTKRVLMLGPAVSLKGSPTVSPVIDALCISVPLPPRLPSSIHFYSKIVKKNLNWTLSFQTIVITLHYCSKQPLIKH